MGQLVMLVTLGILGGVLFALAFSRWGRVPADVTTVSSRLQPPSTGMINMAHIRVAGAGGLGMVAMAVVVAIFVPRIRLTMALALVLGGLLALTLIVLRRRGHEPTRIDPGAHTMFPLPASAAACEASGERPQAGRVGAVEASPALVL